MQHQLADVDVDVLGNVGRQALHLDLAGHEIQQAALLLDARRLALDDDRHRHDDGLVHRELVEVGVQQLVRDGVELVVPDHHARFRAAIELEVDQRVGAGLGVKDAQHLLRIDRDRNPFGRLSILARAVDHGGDPPRPAEAPRLVLASTVALLRVECRVHLRVLQSTVYGLRPTVPACTGDGRPKTYTNNEETDVSS